MHELLPPGPLLLAFVAAASVLAISRGPGVVFIVTRTLSALKWLAEADGR